MNQNDIEHMAQGFPPSHIGKDHEEVVIELANRMLSLQQKMNALLAENVMLKGFIDDECYTLGEAWSSNGQITDAAQSVPETPATDALLNAVRAEGIDICISAADTCMSAGAYWPPLGSMREIARSLRAETDTTSSQHESLAGGK